MKLSGDWKDINEIIVYGLGDTARIYLDDLCEKIKVRFIIENNRKFKDSAYKGIPVYTFEECKDMIGNCKIVIIAQTIGLSQISKSLIRNGYKENKDFTSVERFVHEWFYLRYQRLHVLEVHTAVTTYCTFNCKNCNMFLPYHKKKFHYTFEELKRNIDLLFEHVDYLYKYQLVGGEPFLNKDLERFLRYLKSEYSQKIAHIWIFSNGDIIPDMGLVSAMKESRCELWLSNYENVIDYGERFHQVESLLKDNGIEVQVRNNVRWTDYGFPENPKNFSASEAQIHTQLCGTTFHGLEDGRLYYCNCAWSASKSGLFEVSDDDYLELDVLEKGCNAKEAILNLCLGEIEKGYHSFCRVCGGLGEDNTTSVLAGIQMPR